MPTITMYTTAICPYCIQAERYLKAKGVDRHRLHSRRPRSRAAADDDGADRPAHGAADLHRRRSTSAATTISSRSIAPGGLEPLLAGRGG